MKVLYLLLLVLILPACASTVVVVNDDCVLITDWLGTDKICRKEPPSNHKENWRIQK
jgi:hypothetical protein